MRSWRGLISLCLLAGLAACDAGPSAVLPDGAGEAPSPQVAEAVVIAERNAPKAVVAQSEPAVLDTPAKSDSSVTITDTRYGDWPLWSKNRKYSALENATYHYEKHGRALGADSYEAWLAMVHGFIHNPPKGTETIKRNNGDTLFYNPSQNLFAVMTKAGAPRTLFRPESGVAYWQEQKQIEAQRRTLARDNRDDSKGDGR